MDFFCVIKECSIFISQLQLSIQEKLKNFGKIVVHLCYFGTASQELWLQQQYSRFMLIVTRNQINVFF